MVKNMEKALGEAAYKAATNATIKKLSLLSEVMAETSKKKTGRRQKMAGNVSRNDLDIGELLSLDGNDFEDSSGLLEELEGDNIGSVQPEKKSVFQGLVEGLDLLSERGKECADMIFILERLGYNPKRINSAVIQFWKVGAASEMDDFFGHVEKLMKETK